MESFSCQFPFPSKSLDKDAHFSSCSTSSLSRAKIQLCKQQQVSDISATRLTVPFCSSLPSFHLTLVFHLALSLESFRQSSFLCCVFAHLAQTGKTWIVIDALIVLNNNALCTHTKRPAREEWGFVGIWAALGIPNLPMQSPAVCWWGSALCAQEEVIKLWKSQLHLSMSQLLKDLLTVLYELFSCSW